MGIDRRGNFYLNIDNIIPVFVGVSMVKQGTMDLSSTTNKIIFCAGTRNGLRNISQKSTVALFIVLIGKRPFPLWVFAPTALYFMLPFIE